MKRSASDLKTTHRLSHNHICVEGVKRMDVKLAAQLLSETTARSLKYFGDKGLFKTKDWNDTSQFILFCDSWFDLMNSRVPFDKKLSRHAYAKIMKAVGSKCMYQFQKGLIVSSQSLQERLKMVREKYSLSYILT